MNQLQAPISIGELIDKITILEIKCELISDPGKLENVRRELRLLSDVWKASPQAAIDIADLRTALRGINERLWGIEDAIREKERLAAFDDEFVELARSVYLTNDERARLKREINQRTGSELVEEKSYADYQRRGEGSSAL
ncbi:MAG: DUF6165 family protein [Pseudomonadota bacterium]|nr:DUF6165 family protein [Pseudomonadota bacterium]